MKDLSALFSEKTITEFCRRWNIRELALFGSALRKDFTQDSDVDLLITFALDAEWSLLDHIQMQQELKQILNRDVDLISKRAVEQSYNWIRRQEILGSAQIIFSLDEPLNAS